MGRDSSVRLGVQASLDALQLLDSQQQTFVACQGSADAGATEFASDNVRKRISGETVTTGRQALTAPLPKAAHDPGRAPLDPVRV